MMQSTSIMLPTLASFESHHPKEYQIPVCESECKFMTLYSSRDNPADPRYFSDLLRGYYMIDVSNLTQALSNKIPLIRTNELQDPVIVSRQTHNVLKGVWDSWMENGFKGVTDYINLISVPPYHHGRKPLLASILNAGSHIFSYCSNLPTKLYSWNSPYAKMTEGEVISKHALVWDWEKSWLRALCWHPTAPKLAVCLKDDGVHILTIGAERTPMLRCHDQKNVTCLSWRPYIETELAIGVQKGIIVWQLESSSTLKPGGHCSQLLTIPGHAPVTSVQYSHSGNLLMSSSAYSQGIYVWNVDTWNRELLYRITGGGVPNVMWSPHDDRILATSPSSIFRLWERENQWRPRKWKTTGKIVEAACWSPCSSSLLFASDMVLYVIHFQPKLTEGEMFFKEENIKATPIFDFNPVEIQGENGSLHRLGGRTRQIVWDPSGNRLAVFFDYADFVAVFRVQPRGTTFLVPLGLIYGHNGEYPVAISFQNNFSYGALLNIAWTSSRIQYFPFVFAEPGGSHETLMFKEKLHQTLALASAQPMPMTSWESFTAERSAHSETGDLGGGDTNANRSFDYMKLFSAK